ncbi:MAG TPA: hypothetical protein VII72_17750 [Myxococcota bacterium]
MGLAPSLACLALLILGGCSRHFVVERSAGRIDGERSISTNSDTGWKIQHEPAPGTDVGAEPTAVQLRSRGHAVVYRNVLSKSRIAPLRAEAAKGLGDLLADDEASVWALSAATNHGNPAVEKAARRALVKIFDARPRREEGDRDLARVAQTSAYQLGQGALDVIRWLWDNVYFWPA